MSSKTLAISGFRVKFSDLISNTSKKILGDKATLILKLVNNWNLITNSPFCNYTIPYKISPHKDKFVLTIAAAHSTIAAEFYYIKNLTIEQINLFLGQNLICDIKVAQITFKTIYQETAAEVQLNLEQKTMVSDLCQHYTYDDDLAEAIQKLAITFVRKKFK